MILQVSISPHFIIMKTQKQRDWEKILAEHVHEAESLEEWKERVTFVTGFSY